jgi:hypothetical protein
MASGIVTCPFCVTRMAPIPLLKYYQ